mmetsp:Transcript_26741/g.61900  ORF Transcript_26741/g.61900 Transcript_26741/m.61900 type:complete len:200 (+) Transcript_26741:356-955(+)
MCLSRVAMKDLSALISASMLVISVWSAYSSSSCLFRLASSASVASWAASSSACSTASAWRTASPSATALRDIFSCSWRAVMSCSISIIFDSSTLREFSRARICWSSWAASSAVRPPSFSLSMLIWSNFSFARSLSSARVFCRASSWATSASSFLLSCAILACSLASSSLVLAMAWISFFRSPIWLSSAFASPAAPLLAA